MNRLPWRTLGIAAAILLAAVVPGAFEALALDRSAIASGELWRLITGHAVHATRYHLVWNVVPLVVLGLLFEPLLGRRLWTVLGASTLAVGIGLLFFAPDLAAYCGLSGALNGLLVGGAMCSIRKDLTEGHRTSAGLTLIVVALSLAKIAFEAYSGHAIFTDSAALGGESVPLAHALGALGGAVGFQSTRPSGTLSSTRRAAYSVRSA